jgi:hypothetical protein
MKRVTVLLKPEGVVELVNRGVLRPLLKENQPFDLSGSLVLGIGYDHHLNAITITFQGEALPERYEQYEWNYAEVIALEVTPE